MNTAPKIKVMNFFLDSMRGTEIFAKKNNRGKAAKGKTFVQFLSTGH